MIRLLSIFFVIVISKVIIIAQTVVSDTTVAKPKFIETLYARVMPLCIYTGAGYLKDRINQNLEVGKTFGMIDVGLALGRTALRSDTAGNGTTYLEAKFSMDIAQFGIFSNEMIIGAGGVFNSKNYLMLELSTLFRLKYQKRGEQE